MEGNNLKYRSTDSEEDPNYESLNNWEIFDFILNNFKTDQDKVLPPRLMPICKSNDSDEENDPRESTYIPNSSDENQENIFEEEKVLQELKKKIIIDLTLEEDGEESEIEATDTELDKIKKYYKENPYVEDCNSIIKFINQTYAGKDKVNSSSSSQQSSLPSEEIEISDEDSKLNNVQKTAEENKDNKIPDNNTEGIKDQESINNLKSCFKTKEKKGYKKVRIQIDDKVKYPDEHSDPLTSDTAVGVQQNSFNGFNSIESIFNKLPVTPENPFVKIDKNSTEITKSPVKIKNEKNTNPKEHPKLNEMLEKIKSKELQKLNIVFDLDNTLIYSIDKNKIDKQDAELLENLCKIGLAGELNFTERFRSSTKNTYEDKDFCMVCITSRMMAHDRITGKYHPIVLEELSKIANLYVCTSGRVNYANSVVDLIDPDSKFFKRHRVYSTNGERNK